MEPPAKSCLPAGNALGTRAENGVQELFQSRQGGRLDQSRLDIDDLSGGGGHVNRRGLLAGGRSCERTRRQRFVDIRALFDDRLDLDRVRDIRGFWSGVLGLR